MKQEKQHPPSCESRMDLQLWQLQKLHLESRAHGWLATAAITNYIPSTCESIVDLQLEWIETTSDHHPPELQVEGGLATRATTKLHPRVASRGWTCNWADRNPSSRSRKNCNYHETRKNTPELRVEGGLATKATTKITFSSCEHMVDLQLRRLQTTSPRVASRLWTCNWSDRNP